MQFSLGSNGVWQSQRAKVMPFPWAVSTREMIRIPVRYQIVLRLTPNGLQVSEKETSRQEAEVEGPAYTENSSVIEQPIL